jgi:hypothetical protein
VQLLVLGAHYCRRDWGFAICGSDLDDALASFEDRLKEALVLSAEAGDTMAEGGEQPAQSERASQRGSNNGSMDGKPAGSALTIAFKRLQQRVGLVRTQSEPQDVLTAGVTKKEGSRAQFGGISEPSSPGIPSEMLPDSIRNISTVARRQSSEFRVPSIHAGMRPW